MAVAVSTISSTGRIARRTVHQVAAAPMSRITAAGEQQRLDQRVGSSGDTASGAAWTSTEPSASDSTYPR